MLFVTVTPQLSSIRINPTVNAPFTFLHKFKHYLVMQLCDWADIDPWAEGCPVYLRCKSKFSSSDIFICMSKVVWYFIVFASLDSVIVLENHLNLQLNKNGKKTSHLEPPIFHSSYTFLVWSSHWLTICTTLVLVKRLSDSVSKVTPSKFNDYIEMFSNKESCPSDFGIWVNKQIS